MSNIGVVDIWACILWVKENIHKFGGDPNRITIGGESAGSKAVHVVSISPWVDEYEKLTGEMLFQAVIGQSGTLQNYTLDDGSVYRNEVSAKLGCDDFAENFNSQFDCFNSAKLKDIEKASSETFPVIDTDFMPMPVEQLQRYAISKGYTSKIAHLYGVVSAEGSLESWRADNWESNNFDSAKIEFFKAYEDTYNHMIFNEKKALEISNIENQAVYLQYFCYENTPTITNRFNEFSRNFTDSDALKYKFLEMAGDFRVNAPVIALANQISDAGGHLFFYKFDYVRSDYENENEWFDGAPHYHEVDFQFGCLTDDECSLGDENDQKVSENVMQIWASFVEDPWRDTLYKTSLASGARWYPWKNSDCSNYKNDDVNQCQIYGLFEREAASNPSTERYFRGEEMGFWNRFMHEIRQWKELGERDMFEDLIDDSFETEFRNEDSASKLTLTSKLENGIMRFYGIPYSKKVTRFEHAIEKPMDSDFKSAETSSQHCAVFSKNSNHFSGTEDCLFLDISLPRGWRAETLDGYESHSIPVIVVFGENIENEIGTDQTTSDNIVNLLVNYFDIIAIKLNYRTGPLGFMNVAQFGINDQITGLNWIFENIKSFGGDARNVNLFGMGHGAFFADLLSISDKLNGQIKNIVSIDGSLLSPQIGTKISSSTLYQNLVDFIENTHGCDTFKNIDTCLKSLSTEQFFDLIWRFEISTGFSLADFTAFKDDDFIPSDILKSIEASSENVGKIYMVSEFSGYSQMAVLAPEYFQKSKLVTDLVDSSKQVEVFVDDMLNIFPKLFISGHRLNRDILTAIKAEYFYDFTEMDMNQAAETVVRVVTDMMFRMPSLISLEHQSLNNAVFEGAKPGFYGEFTFEMQPEVTEFERPFWVSNTLRDLSFKTVFSGFPGQELNSGLSERSDLELEVIARVCALISPDITGRNKLPSPAKGLLINSDTWTIPWSPYNTGEGYSLSLNEQMSGFDLKVDVRRLAFWKDVIPLLFDDEEIDEITTDCGSVTSFPVTGAELTTSGANGSSSSALVLLIFYLNCGIYLN